MKTYSRRAARLLLCLLIVTAGFQAVPTQAEQQGPMTLTLEHAVSLAYKHSKDVAGLDRTIGQLGRQHEDLLELSESMQKRLDGIEHFHELRDKMIVQGLGLDETEAIFYRNYQMMYGPEPPEFEDEFMFNTFIKNRDFPHMQVQVAMENAERSKETMKAGLALQMRSLFDQWMSLNEALNLQQKAYDHLQKSKAQQDILAARGAVSDWEVYSLGVDIKKQELSIAQMNRTIENLENSVKSLIGISFTRDIRMVPHEPKEKNTALSELKTYEGLADQERNDVQNARNDAENKRREWNILSHYITDLEDFDRIQAQKSANEAEFNLETVRLKTRAEVHQAYRQAVGKRLAVATAEKQLALSEKQLEHMKLAAERGTAVSLDVSDAETQRAQAENALRQAEREYAFAVYQLNVTVDTGPGPGATSTQGGI